MGVVYKAIDKKLDRIVALKFLASHLVSNDESRRRFIREAKAAAALQHPNICTVYEIDEFHGQTFIAMAYLDGQELSGEIESGPLKVERLLDLAEQVARGLQEAHGKGVVHRDIKPANIMVTAQGQAVLMDFGLAQLVQGGSKLTKEGTSLGTSAYMSPEQTTGEKLDLRTDVWALGVVLYEMATGQLPFQGHYEQAILYSILNEPPEPITGLRTGLPVDRERIVNKCLAKRADERYQSTGELLADVRALKRTTEPGPNRRPSSGEHDLRPSVAVLPFENRSRDEDDEYLSDGIAEDIINALTNVKGLRVAARSSAFHFKGKNAPLEEVAEKLRVGAVVEGTVRRAGQRLRITAQLVDASEGYQIWSERYDRVMADIFDVQDEISMAIVEQLKVKLIGQQHLVEKPTKNDEAYQLYLRGRHHTYRLTGDNMQKGLKLLQQARELDPSFAQAYATESLAYVALTVLGFLAPSEGWNKAKSLAVKAIELDDSLAEAHSYYGVALMLIDWDWPRAEAELRRAVALKPEDPNTHGWLAELLVVPRRFDEALAESQRAYELDPLSVEGNRKRALCEFYSRHYEACIQSCQRVLDLDPQLANSHFFLGLAQCFSGRLDDALETLQGACSSLSYDPLLHSCLGYVLGREGSTKRGKSLPSSEWAGRKAFPTLGSSRSCTSGWERTTRL